MLQNGLEPDLELCPAPVVSSLREEFRSLVKKNGMVQTHGKIKSFYTMVILAVPKIMSQIKNMFP